MMASVVISNPTIVYAEDDWFTRTALAECFADAGFNVLEASSAEAALMLLEADPENISALVTDVRMNGLMDGIALAHHVSRCWPWMGLLIVSGESSERLADAPITSRTRNKLCEPRKLLADLRAITGVN